VVRHPKMGSGHRCAACLTPKRSCAARLTHRDE